MMQTVVRTVATMLVVLLASWTPALAQKVVTGTGADPSFSPLYVGVEGGYFKKHALDVEIKLFSSGSASVPSLIPGDIVVSLTGVAPGLVSHLVSRDVVLVGHFVSQRGYAEVVGDKSIKDIKGLRGKRVAYQFAGTTEIFAIEVLKHHGMELKDIKTLNVEPPEGIAALQRGDLDAIFTFKPWSDRAVAALREKVHKIPGYEFFTDLLVVYMNRPWLEKNQDAAVRFLRAFKEAAEFTNERKDEAAALVARFLKQEVKVVRPLLDLNEFTLKMDDRTMEQVKRILDAQIRSGRVKPPYPLETFIYPDILRKLDPKLVTYRALPQE